MDLTNAKINSSLLGIHFPDELLSVIKSKFAHPEKLFTEPSFLHYENRTWHVSCGILNKKSTIYSSGIFIKVHSPSLQVAYDHTYNMKKRDVALITNPLSNEFPELKKYENMDFMDDILRNGKVVSEPIPDAPLKKPIPNPPPSNTPSPPVSPLNARQLTLLSGIIYLVYKYGETHFASLKKIPVGKSNLFAVWQNIMFASIFLIFLSAVLYKRRLNNQH